MKLCHACHFKDWDFEDPLWQGLLNGIRPGWREGGKIHRKDWEWTLGLYGLYQLACVRPDAIALSVGAGHEWPLYYLANRIKQVHAIDLYEQKYYGDEDNPSMLVKPEKFAPFPYRREALVVHRMDALNLSFNDDYFDFVFSFSSIEHFGGHTAAAQSLREIGRVLKPGGVAAIATELILNNVAHDGFFLPQEIMPDLIEPAGLDLVEPIDFTIDEQVARNPVNIDVESATWEKIYPHVAVQTHGVVITSIMFFLRKPAGWRLPRKPYYIGIRRQLIPQWAVRVIPKSLRRKLKRYFFLHNRFT